MADFIFLILFLLFNNWQFGWLMTVNPLYNDIRYNSKTCYNVNLVCTKISGSCIFHWYSHFILQENIRFLFFLESPRRGDSNKYKKTYDL